MNLKRQHLRPAPPEDLYLRDDPRTNQIADEAGRALLEIERIGHSTDMPAPILHPDQQRPARGVGEGYDRLEGSAGGGEVALELQRLPLRALEDLHEVQHARRHTRK
jgi:hypothetical protein